MSASQENLIFQNLRKPEGLIGHKVGELMATANFELNTWAIKLLEIQSQDHILEIGFGPGLAIRDMAAIATEGHIAGLDYSELMCKKATKLNKLAMKEKRVALYQGDVSSLPDFQKNFDKVLAVNNIMYWKNPIETLTQLKTVMKPGSIISIVFQRHDEMFRHGKCDNEIDLYQSYLRDAGYCHIQVAAAPLTIKRPQQKKQIIAGISVRGFNNLALPATSNEVDLAMLLKEMDLPAKSVILHHSPPIKPEL